MNIHKQLKTIRTLQGITQDKLASLAQCTQKQVSLIEGGEDCYISTLRAMFNALGYDIAAVPIEMKEGGKIED